MRQGDLENNRFDVKYFASEDKSVALYPLRSFGELVRQEPDYGSGARAMPRTSPKQPRYIRITDFSDEGIEVGHEFVTADPLEMECELFADDILFARTGATVGKTYLHEDTSELAVFAGYCIRFQFDSTLILPWFAYFFTKTGYYERWVATIQRPSAQPNINKEEFKTIRIPLPPLPIQRELVAAMNAARALRQQQLAEAEELLGSFDEYLLATLAIKPPAPDNRKIFAVRLSDVLQKGHINPEYYHPERLLTLRAIESAGVSYARLGDLVAFVREQLKTPGENYLSLGHVQSHTGELAASNETSAGSCFRFQAGDVLFMRLRPYLNKVYLAEVAGCCSPEFHVLRVANSALIHADYLAVALRSKLMLMQTVHMMTGNTHPRLANEDVPDLILPVPPPAVQQEIVAEVPRRRAQARTLREAAETGWAAAKAAFEARLLGA